MWRDGYLRRRAFPTGERATPFVLKNDKINNFPNDALGEVFKIILYSKWLRQRGEFFKLKNASFFDPF